MLVEFGECQPRVLIGRRTHPFSQITCPNPSSIFIILSFQLLYPEMVCRYVFIFMMHKSACLWKQITISNPNIQLISIYKPVFEKSINAVINKPRLQTDLYRIHLWNWVVLIMLAPEEGNLTMPNNSRALGRIFERAFLKTWIRRHKHTIFTL